MPAGPRDSETRATSSQNDGASLMTMRCKTKSIPTEPSPFTFDRMSTGLNARMPSLDSCSLDERAVFAKATSKALWKDTERARQAAKITSKFVLPTRKREIRMGDMAGRVEGGGSPSFNSERSW